MLHFPCQSKQCWNKSPRIPLGPKHFQGLITSLNTTAWSKWKPSHKALIHTEPYPTSCYALTCSCASSAREAFSTMQRGASVPTKMFVSWTESYRSGMPQCECRNKCLQRDWGWSGDGDRTPGQGCVDGKRGLLMTILCQSVEERQAFSLYHSC